MRYRLLGTVEQVMDDEIEVGVRCFDGFPQRKVWDAYNGGCLTNCYWIMINWDSTPLASTDVEFQLWTTITSVTSLVRVFFVFWQLFITASFWVKQESESNQQWMLPSWELTDPLTKTLLKIIFLCNSCLEGRSFTLSCDRRCHLHHLVQKPFKLCKKRCRNTKKALFWAGFWGDSSCQLFFTSLFKV